MIHKKFICFSQNRMNFLSKKIPPLTPKNSHKPTISKKSSDLAQRFRYNSLHRMENNVAFSPKGKALHDYLNYIGFEYSCNKINSNERSPRVNYHNLEKYWTRASKCVNKNEGKLSPCSPGEICSKHNHRSERKPIEDLSFKPNVKHKKSKVSQVYSASSVKKTVQRMELGRLRSTTKQWLQEKGIAGSKLVNKVKRIESSITALSLFT